MCEQIGIQANIKFEDEICNIGSVLDGRNLYELISWHNDDDGYLVLAQIPRIGEVIYIPRSFWFEVTGIVHKLFPNTDSPFHGHNVTIRCKQIPLSDSRTDW
jgi:hypothetical protein